MENTSASFEQTLARLEAIVTELESGELSLDATVARFQTASELAAELKQTIADARLRVAELQPEEPQTEDVPF